MIDPAPIPRSEASFRSFFETPAVGLVQTEIATARLLHVNQRFCQISGYTREELAAMTFLDLAHAEDREAIRESFQAALRSESAHYLTEKRLLRKGGDVVWVRVNAGVVRDPDGTASQATVVVEDITEPKRAEDAIRASEERLLQTERIARAEAERSSRLKDEFLATISHELRTPLNAILGWAQILGHGKVDAEKSARGLAAIQRNARAQAQLIDDLLDMSRIISGKIRLDVEILDPRDVIAAAVETIRPAADAKGIQIHQMLDPLAGPVRGDANRLQQVVWNLLNNAVKFTPQGGRVQVALRRTGGHVDVIVADTGQGIEPEFLPFVYDRFRQADGSTTRQHGGLGLGLAIVKQLVELHGGRVQALSPGRHQGATFTVELPLATGFPAEAPPLTAPETAPEHAPFEPPTDGTPGLDHLTVLAVDDEPDALAIIRHALEEHRARVLTASSAMEALELLGRERPDVLLSDIAMPEMDGYELIRRVRALGPDAGGDLPAAALTAFASSEDRNRAMLAGYQMHLAKPVEPDQIVAMVASLAGRSTSGSRDQLPPLGFGERGT